MSLSVYEPPANVADDFSFVLPPETFARVAEFRRSHYLAGFNSMERPLRGSMSCNAEA